MTEHQAKALFSLRCAIDYRAVGDNGLVFLALSACDHILLKALQQGGWSVHVVEKPPFLELRLAQGKQILATIHRDPEQS